MRVASDFRELARRALSGKWVSAVLTTLVASILGADIIFPVGVSFAAQIRIYSFSLGVLK